jgi:fatty-acyl-CoA synthase
MLGLMQDRQLLISTLIDHAARNHGDTEIISRLPNGTTLRLDYLRAEQRTKQLANALRRLKMAPGACVGTLAWNTHRHFEIYFAVSGSGFVCHTINPRLFYEQISYIASHAEDRLMFVDLSFIDIAKRRVFLCERGEMPDVSELPGAVAYEDLIGAESHNFTWPQFSEQTAASLCYTSGTTGAPKGVLYSHRSTLLHTYAALMPDAFAISARDVILPASSMFHANAWGIPYAAAMAGSKLVLPGSKLDGESLFELLNAERATISAGVPTIWLGLLQHLEKTGGKLVSLRQLIIGGAACPAALMRQFRVEHGVTVKHLWGMTETSPAATVNAPKPKHVSLTEPELERLSTSQGRAIFGVELKIEADDGKVLPHDGVAFGNLKVRGWWVAEKYYKADKSSVDAEGWFDTGDVSTIDGDGYMRITDRSKDVIKSGGEWISSIDLENAAVGHPAVAEAAVIGIPHEKWSERPLLILALKDGRQVSRDDMLQFLSDKVAKWWLPDDVVCVAEIPHTATGKILKTKLREQFKNHRPA